MDPIQIREPQSTFPSLTALLSLHFRTLEAYKDAGGTRGQGGLGGSKREARQGKEETWTFYDQHGVPQPQLEVQVTTSEYSKVRSGIAPLAVRLFYRDIIDGLRSPSTLLSLTFEQFSYAVGREPPETTVS